MNLRFKWLSFVISLGVIISMAVLSFATNASAAPVRASGHSHAKKSSIPVRCKHRVKAHGTITYSDNQFPPDANPYTDTLAAAALTYNMTTEGPTLYDNKARLQPDEITTIPTVKNGGILKGGLEYVFHLKKGILWSDGSEITSADWKFGLAVYNDPASGPACTGSCDVISRMDTPDKYTVVAHLKHIDASFLSGGHFAGPVIRRWPGAWSNNAHDAAEKLFNDTSFNFEGPNYPTNGGYQVQTFVTNDRIVSTPMRHYDIMSCGAQASQMIFAFYSDPSGEIAAAATGATLMTTDYALSNISQLKSHKTYKTVVAPAFQLEHLELNSDATYNGQPNPLHNVKVRQALALIINKTKDLESAFGLSAKDAGKLPAYSFIVDSKTFKAPFADPKLLGAWDPITKKYITSGSSQAIKDAHKLMDQAGYSKGFPIDFYTTTAPYRQAELAVISKNLQDFGLTVHQFPTPAGKFFGQFDQGGTLAQGKFQLGLFTWIVSPDPDGLKVFFEKQYIDRLATNHSPINQNYAGITDPRFQTYFTKAVTTVNNSLRRKYYYDAQTLLAQTAYWIPFYYRADIETVNPKLKGFSNNPTSAGPTWNGGWAWRLAK